MSETHVLKCVDTPLLEFSFTEDFFGTPGIEVVAVNEDAAFLMPWGLRPEGESLYKWLQVRALPQNRRFAEELCRSMGFAPGDVGAIYQVSLGLSLNDSYWTVPSGDPRRFGEVNLYENGFSSVLAAVAYTGHAPDGGSPHGMTPELTTDGTLHKAWRVGPAGERTLCKGASNGWDPGEPMSELVASRVAAEAGLQAVPYGLDEWQGELCSTCECFCSPLVAYSPFAVATGVRDLGAALGFCWQLGAEAVESMRDMLVLDCLLMNVDRHFTNFGLLRDVSTGEPLGLGPVFDNGRSLLPMLTTPMLEEARCQIGTMAPAFGGSSFEELARRVMGPRQHEWVSRLTALDLAQVAADFEGGPFEGVVAERCAGLQGILRARARELAEVAPIDLGDMAPMLDRAWEAKGASADRTGLCPAKPLPPRDCSFSALEVSARALSASGCRVPARGDDLVLVNGEAEGDSAI